MHRHQLPSFSPPGTPGASSPPRCCPDPAADVIDARRRDWGGAGAAPPGRWNPGGAPPQEGPPLSSGVRKTHGQGTQACSSMRSTLSRSPSPCCSCSLPRSTVSAGPDSRGTGALH
ncbi:MAG: hypothetical protein WDW38_002938 [Sanguina aurantia]